MSAHEARPGERIGKWSVRLDRTVGRFVYRLHRLVYRLTGGRVGSRTPMGPIIVLVHTGRKSGRQYETPLLAMRHGDGWVVVASNGGRPEHPQWFHNVRTDPDVEVVHRRDRSRVRATVVTGERRTELWEQLTEQYAGWAYYQTLTEREIPVVELRPQD